MITPSTRWSKLTTARWEDAWRERLGMVPGPCLVITHMAGSRSIRIDAYVDARLGKRLVKEFGGRLQSVAKLPALVSSRGESAPISIRGRLVICRSKADAKSITRGEPLVIPYGLAFGTGDHATTANCLRFLVDATSQRPAGWSALDLGCGTGILALAAGKLGAGKVVAIDNDPAAVQATLENLKANKTRASRGKKAEEEAQFEVRQGDALKRQSRGRFDVITANLFSGILIQAAPAILAQLKPGGDLIISGILKEQETEVVECFRAAALEVHAQARRGKWCAVWLKNPY